MADDRPAESEVEALARMQRELEDLRSTVMVRVSRRPTGDIEPTIRKTAKGDTLLLQGQAVNRADYPVLWQWVQDQALVVAGLFTAGNGTTTFGLPNFAGRVPVGVGTLGTDVYALGAQVGAARPVITAANLPTHDHGTHGNHSHNDSGFTNTVGHHGSHHNGNGYVLTNGSPPGALAFVPNDSINDRGGHNHTVDTGFPSSAGGHAAFGSATPTGIDVRQPAIAIQWLIWV